MELVADRGYDAVTVRALSKRAGVSTRTFYRHFGNVEECFGSVCESVMQSIVDRMTAISRDEPRKDPAAFVSLVMRQVAARPGIARVVLVDGFGASPSIRARLQRVTSKIEQPLADVLELDDGPATGPRRQLLAGMVAGSLSVARSTAISGRTEELPTVAPQLSEWLLSLAHLGAREPPPRLQSVARRRREDDPFPDDLRLGEVRMIGDERERLFRAAMRLAAKNRSRPLNITQIRVAAGVSRQRFDAHFDSPEECLLESIEWLATSAATRARRWAVVEEDPGRRTQRVILALCAQAARRSDLASLVFTGMANVGREGLLRRERLLSLCASELRASLPAPTPAAQAAAAAAWQIVEFEVASGGTACLPEAAPLLADVVLAAAMPQPCAPLR